MPEFSRRAFTASLAGALAYPALRRTAPYARITTDASSPIFLNYNENPYGPTPKAREALAGAANFANRYPDASANQLKIALAKKHNVSPENIVLGCGSTEILKCCDAAFLTPQTNLVVSAPTFEAVIDYAGIATAATAASNVVATAPTPEHGHDLKKMAAACTSKTGVVYVCNPNNPTGTIVTRDELAAFIEAVPATTLILVDEAYFEFATAPGYASAIEFIGAHPNVIVARTFSKIYGMAGLRLGYGVGSKNTIDAIAKYRVQDSLNSAGLAAARASLEDAEGLATTREKLLRTRTWLCAQLKSENRPYIPSHGNFVMLDVGTDTAPVIEAFARRNILVGRRFASMPNFLRVTVGTQGEVESFVSAMREIVPNISTKAA